MPGPALPIISPGPVDKELGAIPACFAKAFSLQMYLLERISPPQRTRSRRRWAMLVRRGEHTDLAAPAKAEPADDVLWRDYYTRLPQIRLTGSPTGHPTPSETATEVMLDGNDIAHLVECALRHPNAN